MNLAPITLEEFSGEILLNAYRKGAAKKRKFLSRRHGSF
jgi:hypothetical protein